MSVCPLLLTSVGGTRSGPAHAHVCAAAVASSCACSPLLLQVKLSNGMIATCTRLDEKEVGRCGRCRRPCTCLKRMNKGVVCARLNNAHRHAPTQTGTHTSNCTHTHAYTSLQLELDLNHELAGKPLNFEVQLLGLTPAERMQKATFGAGGSLSAGQSVR